MEITQLGESALILRVVEPVDSLLAVVSWRAAIQDAKLNGIHECLPCYSTLTIFYNSEHWNYDDLANKLTTLLRGTTYVSAPTGTLHKIPVCYEDEYAPDLAEVVTYTGLSREEIIARHSAVEYTVAGLGFSPGFGFLQGLPPELICPRQKTPRTSAPAGSLGIANDQTGIYPSETAGGWNLIGQTPTSLIDYTAEHSIRFKVGDRVQLTPITEQEFSKQHQPAAKLKTLTQPSPHHIRILRAGTMTTIQDLGRHTFRDQGFPKGGAMDHDTAQLLNKWLENKQEESVIEFCQSGMEIQFSSDTYVMVGGSTLPKLNGITRSPWSIIKIQAGDILDCGVLHSGLWGYLAIQGGFQVPLFFGSTSTHPHLSIGGIHGQCLQEEDKIPYFPTASPLEDRTGIPQEDRIRNTYTPIRCIHGAQWDWFSRQEQDQFTNTTYTLSEKSNRVGYRLDGVHIMKQDPNRELTSEGTCPGTIQITNSGQPIVLMADAQSIGGYPKIAHVIEEDQSRFAQIRPGMKLRFEIV